MSFWKLKSSEVIEIFKQRAFFHLNFLIEDYKMQRHVEEQTGRLAFKNEFVAVMIAFHTIDDMIAITLYRNLIEGTSANNEQDRILLNTIALFFDADFPIKKLQPKKWEFEDPLVLSTELVKQYCSPILKGVLWISEAYAVEEIYKRRKLA